MTTQTHSPEPAVTRVARHIGRYVRQHPFSVALSIVLVTTALAWGTLWGNHPLELAARDITPRVTLPQNLRGVLTFGGFLPVSR